MRDLSNATRIVIKIGTNVLTSSARWDEGIPRSKGRELREGQIDLAYLLRMADQIGRIRGMGKQVLIVTSGAIGMGARELGIYKRVTSIEMRQACAAIGQPLLMQEYRRCFSAFGLTIAQILITREVLNNRASYNNLRESVEHLLSMGVIPVFNENDAISTDEIGNAFGDNDQLSALIASKVDAELLLLLSDIDAFYEGNPKEKPDAKPLSVVRELSPEIWALAGDKGSEFSTGGMKTKLKAVEIARDAGCSVIIAHGREKDLVARLVKGEELGTLFLPHGPLKNRRRWLKNARPEGRILIDEGAMKAIRNKRSLLPKGLIGVEGEFHRNVVLLVNDEAHLLCPFSSDELRRIQGKHSDEIRAILGPKAKDLIARPEDIIFLNHEEP